VDKSADIGTRQKEGIDKMAADESPGAGHQYVFSLPFHDQSFHYFTVSSS
jgi:hypothetical protein